MKKIIFGLLMLMGITGVHAQEYEYVPLVREGVKWVYYLNMTKYGENGEFLSYVWVPLTIEFKGDTTIQMFTGEYETFKKCYMNIDPEFRAGFPVATDENGTAIVAMMRENDKRVFAIYTEDYIDAFIPRSVKHSYVTGLATRVFCLRDLSSPIEYDKVNEMWMIYDFNDPDSFIKHTCPSFKNDVYDYEFRHVVERESVLVNGTMRKRYGFESEHEYDYSDVSYFPEWIEGIGWNFPSTENRLYSFISPFGDVKRGLVVFTAFSHVEEDGIVAFKGAYYDQFNTLDNVNDMKVETRENGDDNYYNLMGQPVSNPTQPGIYIHQGKKIVIK